MSDYTPSMEDLLDVWADHSNGYSAGPEKHMTWDERYELGKKALAARDAEVRADAVLRIALFFRSMACPKCEKAGRALRGTHHIGCRPWMLAHSMLLEPWMVSEIASGRATRGEGETK